MNVTVFEAINITKKYRNTLALNQVSMSVMQGDIYGFIGENGAGKTTMIRLLTGLAELLLRKIALFGESNKKLAKQRERIGCIIESPSLYLIWQPMKIWRYNVCNAVFQEKVALIML